MAVETKSCTRCGSDRTLRAYPAGDRLECLPCSARRKREYYDRGRDDAIARATAWNQANPTRSGAARRYARKRLFVDSFKTHCMDCKQAFPPYVLHFDHLPGYEKLASVAELVRHAASDDRLLAEMAKCEVVCANCHAVRTHNRRT